MNRNVKRGMVAIIFLVIAIALWCVGCIAKNEHKAEIYYQDICNQLDSFLDKCSTDGYRVCCYRSDGGAYLFFSSDGVTVTGKCDQGGTVYYIEGKGCFDSTGAAVETDPSEERILGIIREAVDSYLTQDDLTYIYHKPSGQSLPMWITPNDPYYLQIIRPGYTDYMEVMTSGNKEGRKYAHWNILKPDESVVLYVSVSDYASSFDSTYIPGWGNIPHELIER